MPHSTNVLTAAAGTHRARARTFAVALIAVAALATGLRAVYPAADPPWRTSVGVVWHDEGAWVHNARNKALWGAWTQDAWNPMYVAPVFTGLEYLSFEAFGVGVRQARLVSELAGLASVVLLALGLRRLGGNVAGLIGGGLLATNYVYVMYDRAAIMEALMTSFIVASWYCSTRAEARSWWGALAGGAAMLAYFTKAAAAFYLAALGVAAVLSLWRPRGDGERRAGLWTIAGLCAAGGLALAFFVLPHWSDYRFYNWQMSVTRKPSYDPRSLLDRITWFAVLHDTFTRMWFEVVVGLAGLFGIALRWRRAPAAARLLVLWAAIGTLELIVHDVGNERRFVFLIPVLAAATALVLGRERRLLPPEAAALRPRVRWLALPVVGFAAYVVAGPIARLPFIYAVGPAVHLGAIVAAGLTAALYATWTRTTRWLAGVPWSARAALLLAIAVMAGDSAQFVQWAAGRTYRNYDASVMLGGVLPPGTLVQGKLANGLSLENRIRPLFIGHGFGNYDDRKQRDDVRYILTYIAPRTGYEGSQILDVLEAYPRRKIVLSFDVAESSGGHDRAALVDKFGGPPPEAPRAHD